MKRYSSPYLFITLLLVAGYGWLWFVLSKENPFSDGDRLCLVHAATGYPCPSCGTTRSVVFLLKGDPTAAIQTNPIGFLALAALLLLPLLLVYDVIRSRQLVVHLYQLAERWLRKPLFASFSILLILLNWIWNIKKDV
jgi:hypothetical protein